MRIVAVILAGGSGNRFGADKPKQFVEVAGKTILQHSVEVFAHHPSVDEVCVVCRADWMDYCRDLLCGIEKVTHIVAGGKERYHSTLAALNLFNQPDDLLLFHDAVRPLVSPEVISKCVQTLLAGADACAVGVPSTDTIWQEADGHILNIPNRKTLWNAQTPQCFRQQLIRNAYDLALADPDYISSDDCGVVLKYCPTAHVIIIAGEPANIKITYPADLQLAEQILRK